jgi:BirA family biotin operon repressor/biotin-[acetyl-CoA-carboxylase] ligase
MSPDSSTFVSRLERFDEVASTQAIVRDWLADGVAEVCFAVADVQTAGRGRLDRRWQAGAGQALMVSAGFRPRDLAMVHAWRLPAVVALSMLDAVAELLGPAAKDDRLVLKWPNDLVSVRDGRVRKLGGVLTEGVPDGERLASAVVGIGVNVDWPARQFPADLADSMSSLQAIAGRPADRDALLEAWLGQLVRRYDDLGAGRFDVATWSALQVTTGAEVEVDVGRERLSGRGLGVDAETGSLLIEAPGGRPRSVAWGEVISCRVGPVRAQV